MLFRVPDSNPIQCGSTWEQSVLAWYCVFSESVESISWICGNIKSLYPVQCLLGKIGRTIYIEREEGRGESVLPMSEMIAEIWYASNTDRMPMMDKVIWIPLKPRTGCHRARPRGHGIFKLMCLGLSLRWRKLKVHFTKPTREWNSCAGRFCILSGQGAYIPTLVLHSLSPKKELGDGESTSLGLLERLGYWLSIVGQSSDLRLY